MFKLNKILSTLVPSIFLIDMHTISSILLNIGRIIISSLFPSLSTRLYHFLHLWFCFYLIISLLNMDDIFLILFLPGYLWLRAGQHVFHTICCWILMSFKKSVDLFSSMKLSYFKFFECFQGLLFSFIKASTKKL